MGIAFPSRGRRGIWCCRIDDRERVDNVLVCFSRYIVEYYHAYLVKNWLALATLRSKQKIPKSHCLEMDPPVTVERLSQINQEILRIDNEKQQREQTLAAFWEHLPPIDPEVVAKAMQELRDRIRALEDRKRALLQEQQSLIVEGAISNRGGNGNNGGN
ncbi:hypothetical protein EZV62_028242 [Acer yangbiense]|uniref:Uncharacterized protein n=2 Tax=Acereae TaxID=1977919 RepID=A0A5C7GN26_9ROSI|nr:hypothetical protein EZV62_028242 [Acer yangbiense]